MAINSKREPVSVSEPKTTDRAQAEQFARLLFEGMSGFVNLRAIEEPAPAGRKPRLLERWLPIDADLDRLVGDYVEECAASGLAAYLLPHPVVNGGGGLKDIQSQRVIPIDIDKGDIDAKVGAIIAALGEPWLNVQSGGVENGQPKRHLYYRLVADATPADFGRVAAARAAAAIRFGADTAVGGNPAQILRVPGSVHAKAAPRICVLDAVGANAVGLDQIEGVLGVRGGLASNVLPFSLDFSRDRADADMDRVLTQPTLAEGASADGATRFENAGKAIGHFIRLMRDPTTRYTEDQAWQAAKDWNAAEMRPAWDEARLRTDFDRLLRLDFASHGPLPAPKLAANDWARFDAWTGNAFLGLPPVRRYLIDGVLPLGVPGLVAAAGGLGKSYLALDLAFRIATGAPRSGMDFNPEQPIFGGEVSEFGTAVVFAAEDDRGTIHERLEALDPGQKRARDRLRVIPLPDAGGARALFANDREGYKTTPEFEAVRAWLKTLPDLRLVVFDPLQTMVAADITAKPEAGQFVMSTLGTLAVELGATVLVTHHLKKTDSPIEGPEEARAAIRGTTALVDGVRWVYALWEASSDPGVAACGAVVKANGKTDPRMHTYQRLPCGVLRQLPPTFAPDAREELLAALAAAVRASAQAGYPFTVTGPNGLYDQRHRLPAAFRNQKRSQLEAAANALLNAGSIVKGTARGGGKSRSWLDVPEGDFAMGHGVLASGAEAVAA